MRSQTNDKTCNHGLADWEFIEGYEGNISILAFDQLNRGIYYLMECLHSLIQYIMGTHSYNIEYHLIQYQYHLVNKKYIFYQILPVEIHSRLQ